MVDAGGLLRRSASADNGAMKEAVHMLCGPASFVCGVIVVRHWIGAGMIKGYHDMTDGQRKHFAKMLVFLLVGFAFGLLWKAT